VLRTSCSHLPVPVHDDGKHRAAWATGREPEPGEWAGRFDRVGVGHGEHDSVAPDCHPLASHVHTVPTRTEHVTHVKLGLTLCAGIDGLVV
jgi:hypothetical protein